VRVSPPLQRRFSRPTITVGAVLLLGRGPRACMCALGARSRLLPRFGPPVLQTQPIDLAVYFAWVEFMDDVAHDDLRLAPALHHVPPRVRPKFVEGRPPRDGEARLFCSESNQPDGIRNAAGRPGF